MDTKSIMSCQRVLQKTLEAKEGSTLKRHKQSELQVQPRKKGRVTKNALPLEECNLWGYMDLDILGEIISRLPVQDIFLNVSSVCQSWEAACWNYLFWSRDVLDLSITGAGIGRVDISDVVSLTLFKDGNPVPGIFVQLDSTQKYNEMAVCLMRKLSRIMEGQNFCCGHPLQSWSNSIHTIILPYEFEITDAFLFYIAERTPCLEHLFLMCPSKLTISGFTRAIQKWNRVKEIHIGPLNDDAVSMHFMEEMGRNCQELVTLHIHQSGFRLDKRSAVMIAKRLPRLKKIGFQLGQVRPTGVTTLYKKCIQLEEMYFDACRMKPEPEVSPELEEFYPKLGGDFRLTWTVHGTGCPIWKAEPVVYKKEVYEKAFEFLGLNEKYTVEDMLTPEFLKNIKIEFQSAFIAWICWSEGGFCRQVGRNNLDSTITDLSDVWKCYKSILSK